MSEPYSLRGGFSAGRFIRDGVRYSLELTAVNFGVNLQIAEDRGWLSSTFVFRVSGKKETVLEFMKAFRVWSTSIGGG